MTADTAVSLLAAQQDSREGRTVVHLNFVDAAAAASARQQGISVYVADRDYAHMQAGVAAGMDVRHGHGACALPGLKDADMVLTRIPRDKLSLMQLLHDAHDMLREGGTCVIAGANSEGIRSAARRLEDVFGNVAVVANRGGHRAVAARRGTGTTPEHPWPCDVFRDVPVNLRGHEFTAFTRPGVFSWEHIDEATTILAGLIPPTHEGRVLDLGCGAGVLGTLAALLDPGATVHMVDADSEAVRSARKTAAGAGARNATVHPGNVTSGVEDIPFDLVLTNPPFHSGRFTDLSLPVRFIEGAHAALRPGGTLMLVANRTLPYERELARHFGNVHAVHDGPRFKVLAAQR